jgi:ProQ/FINO family
VGIRQDLLDAFGIDVDERILRKALRYYTQRPSYQAALKCPDAQRVDLTGAVVGPVTVEERPRQPRAPQQQLALSPLTWNAIVEASSALHATTYPEASMKLTLIGRPDRIQRRATHVLFRLLGQPPTSLPKELATVPIERPLTWTCCVSIRQWRKVEGTLREHDDDQVILEGYPVQRGPDLYLLVSHCKTVWQQRQAKEAQRLAAEEKPHA